MRSALRWNRTYISSEFQLLGVVGLQSTIFKWIFVCSQAFVEMEIKYRAPPPKQLESSEDIRFEDEVRNHPPDTPVVHTAGNSRASSKQTSPRGSIHSSAQSDSDEKNILLSVERNIATIEKSIQNKEIIIEMDSGDETRAGKLKSAGKRLLK